MASAGTWRPLPARLWAVQAIVPPGTNDTQVLQTVPGGVPVPVGVPVGGPTAFPAAGSSPAGTPAPLPPGVPGGVQPGGGPARSGGPTPAAVAPGVAATGSAPARPKVVPCEVSLLSIRTEIPQAGGEFAVPAALQPAGCPATIAFNDAWLRIADSRTLRFIAEPNTSPVPRDAMIVVGGRSFYVRQMPPPQPGLAAAPSSLTFGLDKNGEAREKTLTVWSDRGNGKFVATPGHPWLTVTPKRNKDGRQSYEVTVRREAGLRPGRHDTFVELSPAGVPALPLRIPVVVEVFGF
jgi:hypothetical protein